MQNQRLPVLSNQKTLNTNIIIVKKREHCSVQAKKTIPIGNNFPLWKKVLLLIRLV